MKENTHSQEQVISRLIPDGITFSGYRLRLHLPRWRDELLLSPRFQAGEENIFHEHIPNMIDPPKNWDWFALSGGLIYCLKNSGLELLKECYGPVSTTLFDHVVSASSIEELIEMIDQINIDEE